MSFDIVNLSKVLELLANVHQPRSLHEFLSTVKTEQKHFLLKIEPEKMLFVTACTVYMPNVDNERVKNLLKCLVLVLMLGLGYCVDKLDSTVNKYTGAKALLCFIGQKLNHEYERDFENQPLE